MKCGICKYEWKPKVKIPKQCPKCKRYDYDGNIALMKNKEEKI